MSFVEDQVRRIDGQLDRVLLLSTPSPATPPRSGEPLHSNKITSELAPAESQQIAELRAVIKLLSTTSSSRILIHPSTITRLLRRIDFSPTPSLERRPDSEIARNEELQWLLLGKATAQIHGLILNTLLEQTIPLSNDIWYWDEVLSSYSYTALYSIQTAPSRLWDWSHDVYLDAKRRLHTLQGTPRRKSSQGGEYSESGANPSLSTQWKQFYHLIQASIRARSISDLQRKVVSPLSLSRAEVRRKQQGLRRLRELSASGLGVLMDEGLKFDMDDEQPSDDSAAGGAAHIGDADEWKSVVEKSAALMETVLRHVTSLNSGVSDFEDAIFASVEADPEIIHGTSEADISEGRSRTVKLSSRLQQILQCHVPHQNATSRRLAETYGRPSRLIRYWLPATILLLSSSTTFRVLFKRKVAVKTWLRELGATVIDFWGNWVMEPIKKIIGTIRHDETAEVAIMSKGSLEGDRASLERMVIDFAIDNPASRSSPMSETEIADIRARVHEGDLTTVLRAYEKDLRRPFLGTVRGDLVRALLIQVQKSKVDIEVALGGIDALLKSQELVFGFVGLTPGVLVCFGVVNWVSGLLGNRRGNNKGRRQGQIIRVLRSIDRILCASKSSNDGMLSYKEHGLLLCEVHVLRQRVVKILPGEIHREFLEELQDLVDIRTGVERQLKVVDRMRWAYAKWIQ